ELIQTAFDEDMIETFFIDEKSVEALYRQGGKPAHAFPNWLDMYRQSYQAKHIKGPTPGPVPLTARTPRAERATEGAAPSSTLIATSTVRNINPQLGRNEPCWCGSGKKYKQCHLGKDARN